MAINPIVSERGAKTARTSRVWARLWKPFALCSVCRYLSQPTECADGSDAVELPLLFGAGGVAVLSHNG